MKRRYLIIVGIVVLVLLAAGAARYVLSSNLIRSTGLVAFSSGTGGMNRMEITGPYGWYCLDFKRVPSMFGDHRLKVSGGGISDCPLFGAINIDSTDYPDLEMTQTIVLEQPTLLYQSSDKTFEIYVWMTKDRANYDRLDEVVDAKQ